MLTHLRHICVGFQKLHHGSVFAGQRTQGGLVMGVGQHPHVKNIVGIHRNPTLECKGLEDQRQLVGRDRYQCFDVALQLCRADETGVDDMCLVA